VTNGGYERSSGFELRPSGLETGKRGGVDMAEVKILVEGYAKRLERGWAASSTACLIQTENKRIITDPGCNRTKLLGALNREGLGTDDMDYVFLSHCHLDHILLAGIFAKAKFVTSEMNFIYNEDLILAFDRHVLGRDIEIIETPGHLSEHLSLLVDTSAGTMAIAGDTIWWEDGEEQSFSLDQEDHSQGKGLDMEKLVNSRRKLIKAADYIIPGHGQMFEVKRSNY